LDKRNARLSIQEIALFGVLGAVTFALQVVMAPLPNIEPVSLLVMIFAAVFGWKCLYPVYVFVVMEILFYGISTWNIYYLYVWTVLALGAILLRRQQQPLAWALLSGVFGLFFGALCGIVDIFIGGFAYAATKWVSGIPFDLLHCGGNFAIALIMFKPLRNAMEKLYVRMRK
jgi:energy-coupling factor transport system substrate-specific component